MILIEAFQVAESINIKKLRSDFKGPFHSGNPSELFYVWENERRYLYVLNYGVIIFGNYDEIQKSEFLRFIKQYSDADLDKEISEDFKIEIDEKVKHPIIKSNYAIFPIDYSPLDMRIVMLNIGQSVGLDYFEMLTDEMLTDSRAYTKELEQKGRLSISKKALLKFIGSELNIKNSIVDNLYILDDPAIVWEDKELEILNRKMKENFDIYPRFKDLDYRLKIVEDNLKLFTDLVQHGESAKLEWIIIVLILIEVFNLFIEKFNLFIE